MLVGWYVCTGVVCHVQITSGPRNLCFASRSATRRRLFGWPQIRMAAVWARTCSSWGQKIEAISFVPTTRLGKRRDRRNAPRELRGRRRSARACTTGALGFHDLHTGIYPYCVHIYKPLQALAAKGSQSAPGIAGQTPPPTWERDCGWLIFHRPRPLHVAQDRLRCQCRPSPTRAIRFLWRSELGVPFPDRRSPRDRQEHPTRHSLYRTRT
jgi:hypothetical protein